MAEEKSTSAAERRKYIRLDTVFPIEFQIVSKEDRKPLSELREGFTRNVGKGGMGIFAKTLKDEDKEFFNFIPNETKLRLVINIPLDKESIECYATIEWIERHPGPLVDTYVFGVSYDFINEIEYDRIMKYVKWLHLRPVLISAALALLVVALIFSSVFLFGINRKRLEGERRLRESIAERREVEKWKEEAEERAIVAESALDVLEKRYMAVQAAFQNLAKEKKNLERRSQLREEDKRELQYQLEELAKERTLLEEQIEKELTAAEAEADLESLKPETQEEVARKISAERIKAEEGNYTKFRELILNEKIHSLSVYVSTHKSSIYRAASLFALAELRFKNGDKSLARLSYIEVIEGYSKSKYAVYASHRLEQLRRNYSYENYTLKYFYDTYGLPELLDYRDIQPYVR